MNDPAARTWNGMAARKAIGASVIRKVVHRNFRVWGLAWPIFPSRLATIRYVDRLRQVIDAEVVRLLEARSIVNEDDLRPVALPAFVADPPFDWRPTLVLAGASRW